VVLLLRAALKWIRGHWAWPATLLTFALIVAAACSLVRHGTGPTVRTSSPPVQTILSAEGVTHKSAVRVTPKPTVNVTLKPTVRPTAGATLEPFAPPPSFGDAVLNSDGTLDVTVLGWTDDYALGAFLQVRGDTSWYCKDAGMVRVGNRFTVRWRAEGTLDDQVDKIALFLYKKSEVHTTTSYVLVKAKSVASKVL